ncbi:MAG: nuclear transport factor 2 family protein [Dehalococcoidia bacterium]
MDGQAVAEAAAMAMPYKFAEAFARRDIAALVALFSPSPEVIYIGTGADERRFGIQQVRDQLQRDLDQADEILFRFDWVRAGSAGPVAWTAAEGALIADLGQQHVELPLRFTAVLEVLGGEWLMVQAHLSVPAAGQELGASFPSSAMAVARAVAEEQPDLRGQAAPDGTVTILFTDLEDSTLMTERLGDQGWMRLLRTHNAILRRRVHAHGGFEVKSQGDGFMFAFSGGREAILCAVDIQREFAAHNESNPDMPLVVRIGMHAGEVVRERGDFFGRNVVLAARIAAQVPAGSIWVSGLLKDLVEAAGDIRFGPEELIDLKGLTGLQRVAEVLWEETEHVHPELEE